MITHNDRQYFTPLEIAIELGYTEEDFYEGELLNRQIFENIAPVFQECESGMFFYEISDRIITLIHRFLDDLNY